MTTLELLLTRRSVVAKEMVEPGPTESELKQILQAAHRVPDHGKLGPWRFVVFQQEARSQFGEKLAEIYASNQPAAPEAALQLQANLLNRAPTVIAVISTAEEHVKIPQWEQVLSAGAACQNILIAASSLGYGAQWLTEWYSYDEQVASLLELAPHHRVAGFIYLGSYQDKPEERRRPNLEERIQFFGENSSS